MSECRQATAERLGSRAWGSEDRVRNSLNCCATGEEDKPANEAERKQKNERPSQLPKEIGSQRKWLTEISGVKMSGESTSRGRLDGPLVLCSGEGESQVAESGGLRWRRSVADSFSASFPGKVWEEIMLLLERTWGEDRACFTLGFFSPN